MNRRNFLKAAAGAIVGAVIAPKVEAAAVDYDFLDAYPREVMVSVEGPFPRGLAYLVNNDTGLFQSLSRDTWTNERI